MILYNPKKLKDGIDFHTIRLDLAALGGVDLLGPRAAEKHWGVGGQVLICNKLSSFGLTFFKSKEMGMFSASSSLLFCKTTTKIVYSLRFSR